MDNSLGAEATLNAAALCSWHGDSVFALNNRFFGIHGQPVNVIVFAMGGLTDGTGGADHMACDFVNGGAIEVCAAYGNDKRVIGLFEAELSECAMNGQLCGLSTGEALSRWCAAIASDNALSDFATAPAWVSAGMPDFVGQTAQTDQDAVSTGCGMAFISWLLSIGHSLAAIAQEMVKQGDAGTLASMARAIGTDPTQFAAAMKKVAVVDDDPFKGFAKALSH